MSLRVVSSSPSFVSYFESLVATVPIPCTVRHGWIDDTEDVSSQTVEPTYVLIPCDQSGTILDPRTHRWLDDTFPGMRDELREKIDALFEGYGKASRPTYRIPVGSVVCIDRTHAACLFVPVQNVADLRPPEHAVFYAWMAALYMVFCVRGVARARVLASVPDVLFWFDPRSDPIERTHEIVRACRQFPQYDAHAFVQRTPTVIWADPLHTLDPTA